MKAPGADSGTRPLAGKRIVVTRPRDQASELIGALSRFGAVVVPVPLICTTGPTDPGPLEEACRDPERFDWIVFTSANGVRYFWRALRATGRADGPLTGVSLCAIGSATAAAIESEGAAVDLVPPEYVAESVVEALVMGGDLAGKRVLLPRAESGREILPQMLREAGAEVVEAAAYRTVPDVSAAERLRAEIGAGAVDLVTFTSSSTVRNFVEVVGRDLGRAVAASIGPITSGTARELGMEVAIEAPVHTAAGLVAAIATYYATRRPE